MINAVASVITSSGAGTDALTLISKSLKSGITPDRKYEVAAVIATYPRTEVNFCESNASPVELLRYSHIAVT